MEIIYHGEHTIELVINPEHIYCNDQRSQILSLEQHHVAYIYERTFDDTWKEMRFDAVFISMTLADSMEETLAYISAFRTKYVVPMSTDTSRDMQHILQDFARRVMLDGLGVPKVLKPGQMIVV